MSAFSLWRGKPSADADVPFEALRQKWGEVPVGCIERASTSDLLKLTDDELVRIHERSTMESTEGNGFSVRGWYHRLYQDSFRGKRVLDVGSGLGVDSVAFAQAGAKVTCLDIVEANLEVIRRVCDAKRLGNVDLFYMRDLSSLAQLAGDFDVIWCIGSLLHAPFGQARQEAQAMLQHLPRGGRWIELAYPRARWEREGRLPFERWGVKTDGGAPWVEWYDLEKVRARLHPVEFETVLCFEFHGQDFNWFDLVRTT